MVKHRLCFSRILFWLDPRLATELDGSVWTYANLSWVETPHRLRRLGTCLFNKSGVPANAEHGSPG